MRDGSASGAESLVFSGRVRSHFSSFLTLEEPATLVLLRAMKTHMLELTGLDVWASVRAKIPAETKLVARRLATLGRAGGGGEKLASGIM